MYMPDTGQPTTSTGPAGKPGKPGKHYRVPRILKLHQASRGWCYFRDRGNRWRDPLPEPRRLHLTGKPAPSLIGMAGSIFAAFKMLYAIECPPSVQFQDISWQRQQPIDEAVGFFTDYFDGISGLSVGERKDKIREYRESTAKAGQVHRHTTGRTGAITWRVSYI